MSSIGSIFHRDGSAKWWIQFTDATGRRRRESADTTDEREATALLKQRIGEVEAGTYASGRQRVTFADLRKLIESDYSINGKKAGNISFVLDHLKASFGNSRAVDITALRIADYVQMRSKEGAANASINREMSALSRMFKLAHKAGMLNLVPALPHLQENNTREGFLAPAEFETLCSCLPDYLKDPVRFLYLTGWRVGEMKTLEWRDVDEKAGMIVLRRAQSKNGRARTLPLEGEIGELIRRQVRTLDVKRFEHLKKSNISRHFSEGVVSNDVTTSIPWVFHHKGKPIGDFRVAWDTARTAAKLGNLLVHDLRRSAVRNLIRAGVSQAVAMELTGHVTASVFRRYDVTSAEDMRLASKRMQEYVAEMREEKKVVNITGGTK